MTMAPIAIPNHLALRQFQGGKQAVVSMGLVVVRPGAAAALLQGQVGLRPIQGLNLALLIDTQHHRLLRRVEIESHHVGELFQKPGVAGEFESLLAMGLEVVAPPNVVDRRFADRLLPGQGATAPLGSAFGLECKVAATTAFTSRE